MCATADRLILTQYVRTPESLTLTQYVRYRIIFNAHNICSVQKTV